MAELVVSLAIAAALAAASPTQAPPDFSGTWVIEPGLGTGTGGGRGGGRGGGTSRGGGLGMGPSPKALVIEQNAKTMTVHQTGARVARIVYRLDGTEIKGDLPAPDNSTRPATFRSRWKDSRLVTSMATRTEEGAAVTFEELRYLDQKGNLVVEISVPGQTNARRTVYARAPK
jgi:hypothetical protein